MEARKDRNLAEGEVTGHAHRADSGKVYNLDNNIRLLEADKDVEVTHEEHGTVTLPPGDYLVSGVVEVDPFEDEIRRVAD